MVVVVDVVVIVVVVVLSDWPASLPLPSLQNYINQNLSGLHSLH